MGGKKKESRPKRWLKSVFQKSSSPHSEGKTSGTSSLVINTASGSATSLSSGPSSFNPDATSLTQGNASRTHARVPAGEQEVGSEPHVVGEPLRQVSELPQSQGQGKSVDHFLTGDPRSPIPHQPIATIDPGASKLLSLTYPNAAEIPDMIVSINKNLEDQQCGERMRRIVGGLEECAKIIDVAIQQHPDIIALVWAGARFILMVVANKFQFMENLQATMSTMVEKIATCEFYAGIYQHRHPILTTKGVDNDLDTDLGNLYTAVRIFLDKAMNYLGGRKTVTGKINNLFKSFSITMEPLIEDIRDKEEILKQYAWMATMERIKELPSSIQEVGEGVGQIQVNLQKLDEIRTVLGKMVEMFLARDMAQELRPQPREITLDSELQELKTRYLEESQQTDIFRANLYVPAQGMATEDAPEEEHFDLWERLENFMASESPQRVCLILGIAGAGKSTFNHYLATTLWEAYDKDTCSSEDIDVTRPIPVFIPLANLHDAKQHNQDLVAELFRRRKWPEERILKARELQFIFILDGYDEIEKRDRNFYIDNRLGDWNSKIVITSRPEYLGSGYQSKFYPHGQPQLLQEYWLAPFSTKNISEYISKYVEALTAKDPPEAPSRSVKDYEQLVERPELRALISNPFLLKMVMTVQPSTGESSTELRRVTLYRKFLGHWLSSAQERLSRIQLPSTLAGPFNILCEESFTSHAEDYCLGFAVELYRHQSLEACYFPNAGRSTSKTKENAIWGKFLANKDPEKRLLRYSSPLVRVGESYRFLHKSLRDFAVAQSMLQDEPLCATSTLLNEFPIVYDYGIIDFLVEEAMQNQELQAQLLACVEESKQNPKVATAAANAITILVRAGKQFSKYDLRGIRIPGADIRSGLFCGAQLQAADLSRARLDRLWLSGADLTGACIDGGEFGEKPYFRLKGINPYPKPLTYFYTPDGELLVASTRTNEISCEFEVWSVTNRKLLHTFRGHIISVTCVAFPPNGDPDYLASGSRDHTVKLWSRQNQDIQLVHTFDRHKDWVFSVAFSPDAKLLASGAGDMACLWSVATHSLIHSFNSGTISLAFSPSGQALAIALRKFCRTTRLYTTRRVELWSTESGKLLQTLDLQSEGRSIAFAPNGQILASACTDNSLELWSVTDGQLIHSHTLPGHNRDNQNGRGEVVAIAFAPDGQMIATSSNSNIQIWSAASRKLVHAIELGSSEVSYSSLTFSPNSEFIVTGDNHGSIRQWLVPRGVSASDPVQAGNDHGHTMEVNDLAFSSDKKLLAASTDTTVRLWSIDPPHMPNLANVLALQSSARSMMSTFSPDNTFLVMSSSEDRIYLRRYSIQDKSRPSRSHDNVLYTSDHTRRHHMIQWVSTVAIAPDGNILASGSRDSVDYTDLSFSPDGQLLVSGCDDCTVRLWSVPRHEMLHVYKGHTYYVGHVAFSPDGKVVASASAGYDTTVRLWSVLDRKSLYLFEGHTERVNGVAFSPDGFLLASASLDRTMRFWSVSTGKLVLNIDVQNEVKALAWTSSASATGGLIAIGTYSGVVQLLQVTQKQGYSREDPAVEVSWLWATDYGIHLNVYGARIEGVTGLSSTNLDLLKQRGAVGEPVVDRV